MESIEIAKRELYSELRKKYSGVTGAGIAEAGGKEYIVVTLSDRKLVNMIPKIFKGKPVKAKVQPLAKVM